MRRVASDSCKPLLKVEEEEEKGEGAASLASANKISVETAVATV